MDILYPVQGTFWNPDSRTFYFLVDGVTTDYVGDYFEWTGSTSTMIKYYYAGAARVAMRSPAFGRIQSATGGE